MAKCADGCTINATHYVEFSVVVMWPCSTEEMAPPCVREVASNNCRAMLCLAAAKINPETSRINEIPLHLQVRCQAKGRAVYKSSAYIYSLRWKTVGFGRKVNTALACLKGKNLTNSYAWCFQVMEGFCIWFCSFQHELCIALIEWCPVWAGSVSTAQLGWLHSCTCRCMAKQGLFQNTGISEHCTFSRTSSPNPLVTSTEVDGELCGSLFLIKELHIYNNASSFNSFNFRQVQWELSTFVARWIKEFLLGRGSASFVSDPWWSSCQHFAVHISALPDAALYPHKFRFPALDVPVFTENLISWQKRSLNLRGGRKEVIWRGCVRDWKSSFQLCRI